jgi:hypothetical protein
MCVPPKKKVTWNKSQHSRVKRNRLDYLQKGVVRNTNPADFRKLLDF